MKIIISQALILLLSIYAAGQKARVSPMADVTQILGESTEVAITYSRPGVKGRTIWGDLVPFDKVWRTGANEATTISFTDDVLIEGEKLPAGTYALFTIPAKKEWTVIFNKSANQWGAFDYNSSDDALRIKVKSQSVSHTEWMQFSFENLNSTSANVVLQWEKLKIPFKIETLKKEGEIRASLKAGFSQTIGESAKIVIDYSRPGVKGRKIWGELVPYNKVWRTGANENTTISFSKDVLLEGKKLSAGTYSLHTIPSENEWTIIINKISNAWGSYDYNEKDDVLRVKVKPQTSDSATEWMLFSIPELVPGSDKAIKSATLTLSWAKLVVPVTIALE